VTIGAMILGLAVSALAAATAGVSPEWREHAYPQFGGHPQYEPQLPPASETWR
jgi:hypothetical protein